MKKQKNACLRKTPAVKKNKIAKHKKPAKTKTIPTCKEETQFRPARKRFKRTTIRRNKQ